MTNPVRLQIRQACMCNNKVQYKLNKHNYNTLFHLSQNAVTNLWSYLGVHVCRMYNTS